MPLQSPRLVVSLISALVLSSASGAIAADRAQPNLPVETFLGTYEVVSCESAPQKLPNYLSPGTRIAIKAEGAEVQMKALVSGWSSLPVFTQVNSPEKVEKWRGSDPVGSPCGRNRRSSRTTSTALVGTATDQETWHFAALCGFNYVTVYSEQFSLQRSTEADRLDFTYSSKLGDTTQLDLRCEFRKVASE